MRILIALTYYRPHVSGLTIYAERLARGLARHGHEVTVLTSRFTRALPAREVVDGVDIVRVPVWRKVSKGAIMPLFPFFAGSLVPRYDVVNIHMPQLESALLALAGRLFGRRIVLTYQCDLRLPSGWFNRLVETALRPLNALAAQLAHAIVVTSDDYATHSAFLTRHRNKIRSVTALVDLPPPSPAVTRRLEKDWNLNGRIRIGFAARFAAEKGVEYLLRALPRVLESHPTAHLVFTGAYKDTVGEEEYWENLTPMLRKLEKHLTFLELLPSEEMPSFYALCDVLAVTSLNSTEAFGLVQVEAMLAGTPVVATDLPGVREPIRRTSMGRLVPPRQPDSLADALIEVIRNRPSFVRPREEIAAQFDLEDSLRQYEQIFCEDLLSNEQ